MPEHMNVAIMLERPTSPPDRLTTISALATAFARFYGEPKEVFRINYVTGASECEAWSAAARLLEEQPGKHELLNALGDSGLAPLTRPTDELTADVAPIRLWPLNTIPRRQFRIPNCGFWNHARWPPEACACGKLR